MALSEKFWDTWDDLVDWAIDNKAKASAAAVAGVMGVSGAVAAPFVVGGDDEAPQTDDSPGVHVQANPDPSQTLAPTSEVRKPRIGGSHQIRGGSTGPDAGSAPAPGGGDAPAPKEDAPKPKADAPAPKPAPKPKPRPKADGVTKREIEENKRLNIPAPPPAQVSPGGTQRTLPRPVLGQGAVTASEDSKKREVKNAIEVKGTRYPLLPLGAQADGAGHQTFAPPENVGEVGWYQDSAEAGTAEEGSVLLSAHINSAQQGNGVGSVFATLAPGDVITVWNTKGKQTRWKVTKSYRNPKDKWELPPEANRTEGPQRLLLVTCGGELVGPPLYYADNLFTEAERI